MRVPESALPDDVERVLVVDDDGGFIRQCRLVLRKLGVEVDGAADLRGAREQMVARRYSTFLIDIFLPDGSGNDLLADVRASPELRLSPVLVVSASDDLEVKLAALESGAEDYLVKPVAHAELAARVRVALRRGREAREQQQRLQEALAASVTDPGTGLHNRRFLFDDLSHRLGEVESNDRGFGVLLCDLDHFKAVNDELGHLVGDRLLREFAALLRGTLRRSDLAARYGGEEFVVVLPDADPEVAVRTAERVRAVVEAHDFAAAPGRAVTVSIGATVWQPGDGRPEDLLERADEAVYEAKAAGRNAVRARVHAGA